MAEREGDRILVLREKVSGTPFETYAGQRGSIAGIDGTGAGSLTRVRIDGRARLIALDPSMYLNTTVAAHRTGETATERRPGRPRLQGREKVQVSLRLDKEAWLLFGDIVTRGEHASREQIVNEAIVDYMKAYRAAHPMVDVGA